MTGAHRSLHVALPSTASRILGALVFAVASWGCGSDVEPAGTGGGTTASSSGSVTATSSGALASTAASSSGDGGAASSGGPGTGGALASGGGGAGEGGLGTGGSGPGTGGTGGGDPLGEVVAALSLQDVNPASDRYEDAVSPRDYLEMVSGWYFGHAT